MSEPVTHRGLQKAVAPLATRRELEIWGGALIGRMDAQFETFQLHMDAMRRNIEAIKAAIQRDLRCDMQRLRSELQTDLTRHSDAIFESTRAMIRALHGPSARVPDEPSGAPRAATDAEPR